MFLFFTYKRRKQTAYLTLKDLARRGASNYSPPVKHPLHLNRKSKWGICSQQYVIRGEVSGREWKENLLPWCVLCSVMVQGRTRGRQIRILWITAVLSSKQGRRKIFWGRSFLKILIHILFRMKKNGHVIFLYLLLHYIYSGRVY